MRTLNFRTSSGLTLKLAPLPLTLVLLAAVGCGHDATTEPSPLALSRVVVTADVNTVPADGAVEVRATLRAVNGSEIQAGEVTWESSNPGTAAVVASGERTATVFGFLTGSVEITAHADGKVGSMTIAVVTPPPPPPQPPVPPPYQAVIWALDGTVSTLGTLASGASSSASAINDDGQVVGQSNSHAFLWTSAQGMRDLGSLPGFPSSTANAINNLGQVVGIAVNASDSHAFLWTESAGMVDLGTLPGGSNTNAVGINDAGAVVGYTYVGGYERAFRWTAATGVIDLGVLSGDVDATAAAINASGQIAGSSGDDIPFGRSHAVSWSGTGTLTSLSGCPTTATCSMYATSISPKGDVAGGGYTFGPTHHAFRWTSAAGAVRIGALPGHTYSAANGINDAGQVVGTSGSRFATRAFSWTSAGGIRELRMPPGSSSSWAMGINKAGMIVGTSQ